MRNTLVAKNLKETDVFFRLAQQFEGHVVTLIFQMVDNNGLMTPALVIETVTYEKEKKGL